MTDDQRRQPAAGPVGWRWAGRVPLGGSCCHRMLLSCAHGGILCNKHRVMKE
jgi:hypothetical protein